MGREIKANTGEIKANTAGTLDTADTAGTTGTAPTATMDVNPGQGDVSNPAVLILPNASALLLYRYEAANHECIGVAFCPHFTGPCQELPLPAVGLFSGWNGEDPYMWLDANAHAHVVYHCYVNDEDPVGCHAVLRSLDGDWTDWHSPSDQAAYYRNVTWDNGTTTTLGRRERPQVLVKDGLPVVLFSGATIQRGDSPDAATFTMGQAIVGAAGGGPTPGGGGE